MRSVYLQSVRSPGGPRALLNCIERYRKRNRGFNLQDVCSQRVVNDFDDDDDEYAEDSFCVNENCTELEGYWH